MSNGNEIRKGKTQYYERKRVINTYKKLQIQNENTERNDI